MKHKDITWGWMLAVDFFFAGMGGAMLLITGITGIFLGEGKTSLLGNIIAPVFIGIGASFLILELGRPLQAWRVFLSPKAILTIGAWCMLLAIGFGLGYASFGIQSLPWSGWIVLRKILAVLCALFGLAVAIYPGLLLSRHKARPFWTGPGMMVLFLVSSLATGSTYWGPMPMCSTTRRRMLLSNSISSGVDDIGVWKKIASLSVSLPGSRTAQAAVKEVATSSICSTTPSISWQ